MYRVPVSVFFFSIMHCFGLGKQIDLAFSLAWYHCKSLSIFVINDWSIWIKLWIKTEKCTFAAASFVPQRLFVASVLVICYHRNKTNTSNAQYKRFEWESNWKFRMSVKSKATMFEFARIYICFARSFEHWVKLSVIGLSEIVNSLSRIRRVASVQR